MHRRPLCASIGHYFHVEPGEARPLAHFVALFVVLGAGLALGRGSANALFLGRLGIEQLPKTYALVGAGLFVASIGYAALADRMRPERLLSGLLLCLAALLAVAWVGIAHTGEALAYRAYFVIFELASEFLILHATLYFSSNFDPLQVKRLLPLGLASLQAGSMLGGAALTALASLYGSQHAAAAWAALAILAAALVLGHHARAGGSPFFAPQKRGGSELRRSIAQIAEGLRFTRRSALLRFSSAGVFFMVVALYCASFAAKGVLAAAFRGPAELGIVFGVLGFVTGGATLLIQAFFSGKLLRHFGTRRVNLAFPLTTLAALTALVLFPGVAAALAVMLNRHIAMPAIRNPSRALLFEALPDRMQGRARALSLGLVLPLALLATSGLLCVTGGAAASAVMLLPGLGAAGLYLFFSLRTNRACVDAMLATLRERLYLPDHQAGELRHSADASVVEELVRGVRQPDDQVAVAYARVLAAGFPDRAADVVLRRMETAGVRTRDMLLRVVGPRLPQGELERLGADGADAHETSTLRQLHFGFRGKRAAALIVQCLGSDNPRLVACGIVGALQHGDGALAARARQALAALLAAAAPEQSIVAGLEAVRQLPASSAGIDLHALLLHPSSRVRRLCLHAFAALGHADPRRLEPALRESSASDDPHLRAACVPCYALLDPGARDALCIAALGDSHPTVVSAAIAALHAHSADFEVLVSGWLREEAACPRSQAAVLEYFREQRALPQLLAQVAARKLALAEAIAPVLSWLDGKPARDEAPRALLRIVLRERLGQAVDLGLLALEGATHDHRLRVVRAGLLGRDRRQTARAIEALGGIELPGLSRLPAVLTLLGTPDPARTGGPAGDAAALAWLRERADPWLRQCAEQALPELASGQAGA